MNLWSIRRYSVTRQVLTVKRIYDSLTSYLTITSLFHCKMDMRSFITLAYRQYTCSEKRFFFGSLTLTYHPPFYGEIDRLSFRIVTTNLSYPFGQ